MRISVTYNLRTENNEADAELLSEEDVNRIVSALLELKHQVTPVEVSGKPNERNTPSSERGTANIIRKG